MKHKPNTSVSIHLVPETRIWVEVLKGQLVLELGGFYGVAVFLGEGDAERIIEALQPFVPGDVSEDEKPLHPEGDGVYVGGIR